MSVATARRFLVRSVPLAAMAVLASGCASIPDVTVAYRPVKWSVVATVAHTVSCNRDGTLALVERGATFLAVYGADRPDPRFQLRLKDLDRFYADADMALTFTDDGRLKSINHSATGQGESLVKSVIGAAAAVAATPAIAAAPAGGVQLFSSNVFSGRAARAQPVTVCSVVRKWTLAAADEMPQVSLVQQAVLSGPTAADGVAVAPSKDQAELLAGLREAGLDLSAKVVAVITGDALQPVASPAATVQGNEVPLVVQQVSLLKATALDATGTIGAKSIQVPLKDTFVVPIPKAALFGKQSFALALAESGRITSLGYGRTAGAPAALGAVTALANSETSFDSAEAAALKAASDLIAQQQRFNTCKLKPAECK